MPYKSALRDLQRFFTIRKRWSPAVQSNTGCPEGCPLSVVMVALVAWFVTNAVSKCFPGRTVSSYVDDWTIRDVWAHGLVQQVQYVQEIAGKLGLKISMDKSVMYATTPAARKQLASHLRNAGLPPTVVDSGKSLGCEFQSRAARVVSVRNDRVEKSMPKIQKLGVMPWSHTKKASILVRGILPSMLYGCEFHDMGAEFMSRVRSLENGAVWKGKQYMSHYLSPLLSTQVKYEPWMWVLQRCFQSYVRLLSLDRSSAAAVWNQVVERASGKHPVGPTCILIGHLRRLGWICQADFKCTTQNGDVFNLDQITTWQFKVQVASSIPAV